MYIGRRLEIPEPSRQAQGKGILRIWEAGKVWVCGVVIGRLLAARRERRFLISKSLRMEARVVVFGSL